MVVLAQEEARLLGHNYIGTEHILLGIVREGDGVAAKALEALDIPLEAVRDQVEEIVGTGPRAPSGHIPFTPGPAATRQACREAFPQRIACLAQASGPANPCSRTAAG